MTSISQKNEILFDAFSDGVIAFNRAYVNITGSITCALLLSQLAYWSKRMDRDIYKTNKELCEETGLSIKELKGAKKRLQDLGFINTNLKGIPATTFYTINKEKIIDDLCIQKGPTSWSKRDQLDRPKGTNQLVQKGPTIYRTKTTTETTTDINPLIPLPGEVVFSKDKSLEEDFEEVWKEYPHKVAKEAARRKYIKARRDKVSKETIAEGVKDYKSGIEYLAEKNKTDKKVFVPSYAGFAVWLHNKRWNDPRIGPEVKKPITPELIAENIAAIPTTTVTGLDANLWKIACTDLIASEGYDHYRSWFGDLVISEYRDGRVYFKTTSKFKADHINQHFKQALLMALQKCNKNITECEVMV